MRRRVPIQKTTTKEAEADTVGTFALGSVVPLAPLGERDGWKGLFAKRRRLPQTWPNGPRFVQRLDREEGWRGNVNRWLDREWSELWESQCLSSVIYEVTGLTSRGQREQGELRSTREQKGGPYPVKHCIHGIHVHPLPGTHGPGAL